MENKDEDLLKNVQKDYEKLSKLLPEICKYIFYVKNKSPEQITIEIVRVLRRK